MGVAAGTNSSGNRSYTMLLMVGKPDYAPVYTYTWADAVADGAGSAETGSSGSEAGTGSASTGSKPGRRARGARADIRIRSLKVRGHRLVIRLARHARSRMRCSLIRAGGHIKRSKRCAGRVSFTRVPSGRYRLRVSSSAGVVTRRLRVR